jgi:carboxylesterase
METLAQLIMDKGFYFEGTNGKTVVLVHGLTGAPNEMKFVGKQLHKQGFTVVCPLLAGHGTDETALLKTRWRDWYRSLEATFLAVRETTAQVYVAGICVGGMLGLYLAYRHPKAVAGAVVYSAALRYDGWNIPKSRIFAPLFPYVGKLPGFRHRYFLETAPFGIKDDRLRERVMKSDLLIHCLPRFPYPSLAEMYRLSGIMKPKFQAIKTPTLLLHARNDDVSHLRNSQFIAARLGGQKRLHVLEDSYHMIHIDRERHTVAQATADFFAALPCEGAHA